MVSGTVSDPESVSTPDSSSTLHSCPFYDSHKSFFSLSSHIVSGLRVSPAKWGEAISSLLPPTVAVTKGLMHKVHHDGKGLMCGQQFSPAGNLAPPEWDPADA